MTLRGMTGSARFLLAAALVAGCDDPATVQSIDDLAIRDMALVAADETLEVVSTMRLPLGIRSITGGIPSLGGQVGFGRPGGRHGFGTEDSGTTVETLFDANGNTQEAYDSRTTARIEVETAVEGVVSRDNWSATIYRERRISVTGLEGEETQRTYNGAGSSSTTRSRHTDEGDRTYDMTGAFSYVDVVVPIPGSDPGYPLSGRITRSMSSIRTDTAGAQEVREMEMMITFDGDETAVAVINGEEYEIDLSTTAGHRPWRRGHHQGFGG